MKIDNRAPATVLLFALSLAGTACVAQARHDEALAETRYYQRRYQDLESAMGPIEAENERLHVKRSLVLVQRERDHRKWMITEKARHASTSCLAAWASHLLLDPLLFPRHALVGSGNSAG